MAELVTGFLLPHVPLIKTNSKAPSLLQRQKVFAAFATIAQALRERRIDTVVVIGSDHCSLFGSDCLPPYLIATGDVEGPIESWLGMSRRQIPVHPPLAKHILTSGFAAGIDWSCSTSMVADHAIMVPHHFTIEPNPGMRTIPIYLNSGVSPTVPMPRAAAVGAAIGDAIRSWPGSERVAILGTGGISHWVGMAQMGQINESWDRQIIAWLQQGDLAPLLALSDAVIVANSGNGGLEVKNFVCAMNAMPNSGARLIAYEPVKEWIAGCGFLEILCG
jgi:protocatechuate 4,5-dioxygenase beta chain